MILATASIMHPEYVPTDWQTYLLTTLIMLSHACLSSMPTLWIAKFNSVGTIVNIICLAIVIITIPVAAITSPKFQPNEVAWGIQNMTDFPDGVALMMSFLAIIWTMSGTHKALFLSYMLHLVLQYAILLLQLCLIMPRI